MKPKKHTIKKVRKEEPLTPDEILYNDIAPTTDITQDRTKHLPKKPKKDSIGRRLVPITKETVKKHILKARGIILTAKKTLGISRTTIYRYITDYNLEDYVEQVRDLNADKAMATVIEDLDDIETAKWYLTYIVKKRGISRQSVNISGSQVVIAVNSQSEQDKLNGFLNNTNIIDNTNPDDDGEQE